MKRVPGNRFLSISVATSEQKNKNKRWVAIKVAHVAQKHHAMSKIKSKIRPMCTPIYSDMSIVDPGLESLC